MILTLLTLIVSVLLLAGCNSLPTASAPADQRFAATVTAIPPATLTSAATSTPVETVPPTLTSTVLAASTSTTTPVETATITLTDTPVATSTVAATATPATTPTSSSVATATAASKNPTATPAGSVPSSGRTVTLADDGQSIGLRVGDSFLLKLGDTLNWTATVADQSIVSRQVNIIVIRGAQGVYVAHKAGQTTLTAVGGPPCLDAQPPCAAASRLFRLTIVVH